MARIRIGGQWARFPGSFRPHLAPPDPGAFGGYLLRGQALATRAWLMFAMTCLQISPRKFDRLFPTRNQAYGTLNPADCSNRVDRWLRSGQPPKSATTPVAGVDRLIVDRVDELVPRSKALLYHFVFRLSDADKVWTVAARSAMWMRCPVAVTERLQTRRDRCGQGLVSGCACAVVAEDALRLPRLNCLDSLGAAFLVVHELLGQERYCEAQRAAFFAAAAATLHFRNAPFMTEATRSMALSIIEIASRPQRFWSLSHLRPAAPKSRERRSFQVKTRQARKRLSKLLSLPIS